MSSSSGGNGGNEDASNTPFQDQEEDFMDASMDSSQSDSHTKETSLGKRGGQDTNNNNPKQDKKPKPTPGKSTGPTSSEGQIPNRYSLADPGPEYIVVLEKQPNAKCQHATEMAGQLYKQCVKYKQAIPSGSGRYRLRMLFDSPSDANTFLENKFAENNGWKPFIPRGRLVRWGIVRQLPPEITREEILQWTSIPQGGKVMEAERQTRNSENGRVPTNTWKITFEGKDLPKQIEIYKLLIEVEPYVHNVRQCENCLGFDHKAETCPKKKRCNICGKADMAPDHTCKKFCIFCKTEDHCSTDRSCPRWAREKKVKKEMATSYISYAAATKKINQVKQQAPKLKPPNMEEGFPTLPENRQTTNSQNYTKSSPSKEGPSSEEDERTPISAATFSALTNALKDIFVSMVQAIQQGKTPDPKSVERTMEKRFRVVHPQTNKTPPGKQNNNQQKPQNGGGNQGPGRIFPPTMDQNKSLSSTVGNISAQPTLSNEKNAEGSKTPNIIKPDG